VRDERSVADALADAYGAVNAVSLYLERGQETFQSIHVESAERVAAQAERKGVKRLIHVSGIGADAHSQSLYIRKRGEGELAVRQAFADAILIRPAVMFGRDDAFLTPILKLLNRHPVFPMFGNGQMRLQPVYVEDVGQAIAKIMQSEQTGPTVFECGGPECIGIALIPVGEPRHQIADRGDANGRIDIFFSARECTAPLGGRSERSTGIAANPLHHGTEAIRTLRREMFAQTHAFEQFDGIGVQNLPRTLARIDSEQDS